jgi:transcription antitermination factor NusG
MMPVNSLQNEEMEKVDTAKEAEMSLADEQKGSDSALDGGKERWYIAECKPTKEGTIRKMLTNDHLEVYVASRIEEKVYKSRNRYKKETVVIPGKVFVRTTEDKLMPIMLGYSSVHRFMLNRAMKDRAYAFVPENEMRQLQYMLGHAENPVLLTIESLKVNQKVRVMRGPLAGLEGWFHKEGHTSFVVIKVTMGVSHYVYTEVPLEDIQIIEE